MGWIKEIDEELSFPVKFLQVEVTKLYESAYLQSAMVFDLNNKLILRVDTLSTISIHVFLVFITLYLLIRSTINKQKHKQSIINPNKAFNNIMFMTNNFKKPIFILV